MDRKNFEHIEMFTRVVEFGSSRVGLFPQNTFAGQSFAELGSALSKVSEHAALHAASKGAVRAARKLRQAARENLENQLRRISVTAEAISTTKALDGQFRIPKWTRDQELVHIARTFA